MRKLLFRLLYRSGLNYLLLNWNLHRRKVPILLFHRISPHYDPFTEPIDPKDFEEILSLLLKWYVPADLNQLRNPGKVVPNNCFIVFDDATEDFYSHAWPILKKLNIPVTMFVPADPIDRGLSIWNYELLAYFLQTDKNPLKIKIADMYYRVDKRSSNYYKQVMAVHSALLNMDELSRGSYMEKIQMELCPGVKVELLAKSLSWKQLSFLITEGLNIGSHSLTHSYLPNTNQLAKEVSESKRVIEEQLSVEVAAFAYPNGGCNAEVIRECQKSYKLGFMVGDSSVSLQKLTGDNMFRIPRYNISDNTPEEVFFRINGFHKIFQRLLKK